MVREGASQGVQRNIDRTVHLGYSHTQEKQGRECESLRVSKNPSDDKAEVTGRYMASVIRKTLVEIKSVSDRDRSGSYN